jgi:hypothetical protein
MPPGARLRRRGKISVQIEKARTRDVRLTISSSACLDVSEIEAAINDAHISGIALFLKRFCANYWVFPHGKRPHFMK